jgi:hypothetical protein
VQAGARPWLIVDDLDQNSMLFLRKDPNKDLRSATVAAVRQAAEEYRQPHPIEELFGFALCVDDDLRTLYQVSCTRPWVRERDAGYPGVGFIYVEWQDSANDVLFEPLSRRFAALADEAYRSDVEWAKARDGRFESLVLALKDCRDEGRFAADTLLCVGSTDPSEHLEALAMRAVDRLNSRTVADQFAKHLGYEQHRNA